MSLLDSLPMNGQGATAPKAPVSGGSLVDAIPANGGFSAAPRTSLVESINPFNSMSISGSTQQVALPKTPPAPNFESLSGGTSYAAPPTLRSIQTQMAVQHPTYIADTILSQGAPTVTQKVISMLPAAFQKPVESIVNDISEGIFGNTKDRAHLQYLNDTGQTTDALAQYSADGLLRTLFPTLSKGFEDTVDSKARAIEDTGVDRGRAAEIAFYSSIGKTALTSTTGEKQTTDQAQQRIDALNLTPDEKNTLAWQDVFNFGGKAFDALGVLPVGAISKTIGGKALVDTLRLLPNTAEGVAEAERVLTQAGVAPEIAKLAAGKFAATTDAKEVQAGLDAIERLQNTTKAAAEAPARTGPVFSATPSADALIQSADRISQVPEPFRPQLAPIYEKAATAKTFIDELGTHVANEFGGTMESAPLKPVARIAEELSSTHAGDTSLLTNLAQGTITLSTKEDILKALGRVRELGTPVDEPKMNLETPLKDGYRAVTQEVRTPSGQTAEIQLTYPQILKAKQEFGDALTEQTRTIEQRAAAEKRPLTAVENKQIAYLTARKQRLYDTAYKTALNGAAAAQDTARPISSVVEENARALEQRAAGTSEKVVTKTESATSEPTKTGGTGGGKKPPRDAEAGIAPGSDPHDPGNIEKKIVAQVFRMDKLNLLEPEEAEVARRLDALGLTTRGVKTFADMEEAAKVLGTDVPTLLKNAQKNRITDSEVVALRNLINNNAQQLARVEEALLKTPGDAALGTERHIAELQMNTALKKLVNGGTEAGRAVASFRILANRNMDPAVWFQKAARELDGKPFTDEHRRIIQDLIDKSDRHGLATFISMLRTPTFAEKAQTLWKAGLLTSFTTHLANIGGNATMGALMTASDLVAAPLDVLASLVTGVRTSTTGLRPIIAKATGTIGGLKDAAYYLKTGAYTADMLTKYDLPRAPVFKSAVLRGYTESVFRSLGAEDIVFRQAAISESMEKSALVIAKNEGLSGAAVKERVRFLLQNPTNEMTVRAIDDAEYATFTSKNVVADMVSSLKNRARGTKGPAAQSAYGLSEFVLPFVKTPLNVAARIADFSPAGFVKAMVRFANPETRMQENLVKDLSRAITGTGMMAFGAYLYQHGLMTGNTPESAKDRAQFSAEGKQANSIYLFGAWRRLDKFSPLGNLMGLGAEFERLGQTQSGVALGAATTFAGAKGLLSQTFLKGLSGALDAVNNPEQNAQNYIQSAVASSIPAVIGRVTQTIDPTARVPDGILQTLESRLPFLSNNLPAKRDVFGNVVQVPGGRLNLIDPFASTNANNNPLFAEAKRVGVSIGQPSSTVSKTKLDNREYSAFQAVRGSVLEKELTNLVASDGYKKMNITEQQNAFEDTITKVNRAVNEQVFPALMIRRYKLDPQTNPDLLRTLLTGLNGEPRFKNADTEVQGRVIKALLGQRDAPVDTGDTTQVPKPEQFVGSPETKVDIAALFPPPTAPVSFAGTASPSTRVANSTPSFIAPSAGDWVKNLAKATLQDFPLTPQAKRALSDVSYKSTVFSADTNEVKGAAGEFTQAGQDAYEIASRILPPYVATKVADLFAKSGIDQPNITIDQNYAGDVQQGAQTVMAHEMIHALFEKGPMGSKAPDQDAAHADRMDWLNTWDTLASSKDTDITPLLQGIDKHLEDSGYDTQDEYTAATERYAYLGEEALQYGPNVIPLPLRRFYTGIFATQ